ncbi:MAG: nucleotidyltransferase domain-containing protein [Candidatus Pacearchaeota archaeon]
MTEETKKAEELLSKVKEKEKPLEEEKISKEAQKQIEQLKTKLETFKKSILKKFPFIDAIGLIPPQAAKLFEEENIEKEKLIHIAIIISNEKEKEFGKVKTEAIKLVQAIRPKIWLHIYTINEIWEMASDGKYDMVEAIGMSMPMHDKGILGALRVASIHKSLCIRKFERYIVSYVIAGSLIRGTATKTSDIDVFVIIDDTDVKRMTRTELRDRLRGIIYGYVMEAADIAGVKNKLSPQIYILTEFWEGIRDANPIFFTFVRDGVPLYDKGTFTPWKLLLKMGKITGTPEAIERFLTIGEKVEEVIDRKMIDIATEDIYWSVITPSQGALMLYGLAPPTPKETVELMKKIFYEKEKLLEKKYIDFLEHIVVDVYKAYEHEKLKKISGKEIDELLKGTKEYIKRIRKLVEEVGKRSAEKTIVNIYKDIIGILEGLFGKFNEDQLVSKFKLEIIEKGKLPGSYLKILDEVIKAKKSYELKNGLLKMSRQEVESIRKDAQILIAALTEYSQRQKLFEMNRLRFSVKIGEKEGEIYLIGNNAFVISDLKTPELKKIDLEKSIIKKSNMTELEESLKNPQAETKLSKDIIERIEKLLDKKIEFVI